MMRRMNLGLTVTLLAAAFLLLPATALPVRAEQDEVNRLQKQITQLEARVKLLETLLEKCMAARHDETAVKWGWQNKKHWRSLEVGMNEKKVKEILGEPVKIIKGTKTLWYYPNFYGGYVSFDESGKLTGWNEP